MNNINVLTAEGNTVQVIADVDVAVCGDDMSLTDFVHSAVFDKLRERATGPVKPGRYTVRMLLVVVGEEE